MLTGVGFGVEVGGTAGCTCARHVHTGNGWGLEFLASIA